MAEMETIRRRRRERFRNSNSNGNQASVLSEQSPSDDLVTSAEKDRKTEECGTMGRGAEEQATVIIPSEFECILCLRLYHEPVSLPCGHTYCRGCLKRALASKPQCPMCRAACRTTAGESGTNLAMVNIIKSQFGKEYDARGKEAEKDAILEAEAHRRAFALGESVTPAPDGSVSMPVCLLDVLLFPHQPVTLYLFEPRYITLVNRCLSDTRRFAVFSDRSPATGAAGSILEISDARMVGGGQYLVMCRGVSRCMSVGEFEIEEGTRGLRYARVAPFEDDEEGEVAAAAAAAGAAGAEGGAAAGDGDVAGARTGTVRTADDVLGSELRELADRTSAFISTCISQLSTRQRTDLIRRCGEPPKVGNSSLSSYRKLSFWLPSALSLGTPATSVAAAAANTAAAAHDRRAAMFRSRSLRQRLSEACEAVMASDAVVGSTSRRRERGVRRLFCPPGNGTGGAGGGAGVGGGGRPPILLSSAVNSVFLVVGILAALYVYQKYSRG